MSYAPEWDIDLKAGEFAETRVKELLLLEDCEIEVKHDRKAMSTGNLYIETFCRRRDGWHPSGVNVTAAKVWFFVLDTDKRLTVSVATDELRRQVERFRHRAAEETDGSHPTRGCLSLWRASCGTPRPTPLDYR